MSWQGTGRGTRQIRGDVLNLRSLLYELSRVALFSDLAYKMGIKVSPWLDSHGHHMK